MLIPKIGGVAAHPANVHRLLSDEQQLVLVFPEGRKGTEKLYRDRYRLRRFGRGGFVEAAMRAEAQLVPTCVVGAEEAAPVFGQVDILRRLTGLIYFPITPTFPALGPLGLVPFPTKWSLDFGDPVSRSTRSSSVGAEAVEDKALVQTLAQEIRAQIQENLHDMLAKRKSVWLG
jgi:1-acyl-sn-glycerol-3-phosphate acyltransferase